MTHFFFVGCDKFINFIKKNKNEIPFKYYLDPEYEGCSQECSNSHIYSVRFGKYANRFNYSTIEKLVLIREAIKSKVKIVITYNKKENLYEEYDLKLGKEIMEIYKPVLNTSGMNSQTRKMFENIKYGVGQLLC